MKNTNPAGMFCKCANPAVLYKHNDFVCARCDALERVKERPRHSSRNYTQASRYGQRAQRTQVIEPYAVRLPGFA